MHPRAHLPVLLALTLLTACSEKDEGDDGCTPNSAMEQDTNQLISDYRESIGLGPLELDACVSDVARGHSEDMASGAVPFSHDGFEDRAAEVMDMMAGVTTVGENVAWMTAGYPDPAQTAYEGWLGSPPHLENIETDVFNLSGMAVVENDAGELYFTHLLVAVED